MWRRRGFAGSRRPAAYRPAAGRGGEPRILILGSLPGAESLRRQQYYAHPQNGFWRIMGALFGAGPVLGYPARLDRLMAAGVALWDVCAEAEREGSLDAAIRAPRANDLAGFLSLHGGVEVVGLNGGTAAKLFDRLVAPTLGDTLPASRAIRIARLPSTSPAHARMRLEEKVDRWREGLGAG
ncbi:DNA-deoxyinosine glycosylase [Methyloraptor flagellatus]|uniref:DNA-deoxyinosine glycosylase n=1 Tax=Methyloraptor flagellatus TaxID=3162530 RepID=A0AAU7XCQ3_9HYPH